MNPGSNLLKRALRLIAAQPFQYYAFVSRTTAANLMQIPVYAAPVTLLGSVQAVPRNLYIEYGLDFQRNYLLFYVSTNVLDIERDVSGDQMAFSGHKFQCLSNVNWFPMDGWVCVLAVQIQG